MFQKLRHLFRKQSDELPDTSDRLRKLSEILGIELSESDQQLFLQALRHKSIIDSEQYAAHETYERLEFLGDAVLDLIISELLYSRYPKEDEGFLTKARSKLVKGETLAFLARKLELYMVLEIGDQASRHDITLSKGILSDQFESVIGALYLTKGYEQTSAIVKSVYNKHVNIPDLLSTADNHKSLLMERMQFEKRPLPVYEVLMETGPGHDKTFDISVRVGDTVLGRGKGKSKKEAEQAAARHALKNLQV
ncbi:MAG: ribonuclease III [Balneolaceae bacterium]